MKDGALGANRARHAPGCPGTEIVDVTHLPIPHCDTLSSKVEPLKYVENPRIYGRPRFADTSPELMPGEGAWHKRYTEAISSHLVGYARVSTHQQDLASQQAELTALGIPVDLVHVDH